MSTNIWIGFGIVVDSYVDLPTIDGGSRKWYRITNEFTGEYVTLSSQEFAALFAVKLDQGRLGNGE